MKIIRIQIILSWRHHWKANSWLVQPSDQPRKKQMQSTQWLTHIPRAVARVWCIRILRRFWPRRCRCWSLYTTRPTRWRWPGVHRVTKHIHFQKLVPSAYLSVPYVVPNDNRCQWWGRMRGRRGRRNNTCGDQDWYKFEHVIKKSLHPPEKKIKNSNCTWSHPVKNVTLICKQSSSRRVRRISGGM